MSNYNPAEIRKTLTNRDRAVLYKDFLFTLYRLGGDTTTSFPLSTMYENMTLQAYNLRAVIPLILEDSLVPYGLVEQDNDRVRITMRGRIVFEKINRPGVSLDEILTLIESGIKETQSGDVSNVIKELISKLQDIYRPRVFFNIVPGQRVNALNVVLKNSGRSPAFNISCFFDPDLPYYDKTTLSSLSILNDLPFLEQGQEVVFFFNILTSILEDNTFPKKTNVKIKYQDAERNAYTEEYTIDLEKYKGILVPDTADIKDIHRDLENIRRELDNLQRRGLLVKSPEDIKKELEDLRRSNDAKQ